MMRLDVRALGLGLVLCVSACADDDVSPAGDSDVSAIGDTTIEDTSVDDTIVDDTTVDDTSDTADATPGCNSDVTPEPGLVVTDRGALQGTVSDGVAAFLGVPYAAPPVGPLRFRAPADVACWTGVRAATAYASACIQKDFQLGQASAEIVGSEDCLYLNVWAPTATATPGAPARPVLVFVHGGGNVSGATANQAAGVVLTDGHDLVAREDVVVVSLDYRLGPLGFLALPELSAREPDGASGNYGLMDQIAALEWVQRNIAAFGGDPTRVMLFGESAGALDTLVLMTAPPAAGLFQRAAAESGAPVAAPLAQRQAEGEDYLDAVGCGDAADRLACLDGLSLAELIAPVTSPFQNGVAAGGDFGPTIDGRVLVESPLVVMAAGRHHHVPLLIGANADETSITVPADSVTPAQVTASFATFGEPFATDLLALYPPGTTNAEARTAWVRATTDAQFVCTARRVAATVAPQQTEPVWRYFFTHTGPGVGPNAQNGAFHGIELFYVFGGIERVANGAFARQSDRDVVAAMMGYWARFAATGDPNDATPDTTVVAWPRYDAATDPVLTLAAPPFADAAIRDAECDLWDAIVAPR